MSNNWLTAADVFRLFGFRPSPLARWRKGTGCPLGRAIQFDDSSPNRILYWRSDLEEIKSARVASADLGPRITRLGET